VAASADDWHEQDGGGGLDKFHLHIRCIDTMIDAAGLCPDVVAWKRHTSPCGFVSAKHACATISPLRLDFTPAEVDRSR
jgi:hypothetical protein